MHRTDPRSRLPRNLEPSFDSTPGKFWHFNLGDCRQSPSPYDHHSQVLTFPVSTPGPPYVILFGLIVLESTPILVPRLLPA